ncbi:hypothetical protein AVEN_245564-1 [Araneus ventricosus]|uniref:Uncharacterized protein n=1 Tax=Araneus ventricosus TaxID=182803 RepID=A0A4Y2QK62_ARAVE|nr:hypothetical protein AVEN_245564-1 [Araneus ventricosus]
MLLSRLMWFDHFLAFVECAKAKRNLTVNNRLTAAYYRQAAVNCSNIIAICNLNGFFKLIETKVGRKSTIKVRRPHIKFHLSKSLRVGVIAFRRMRLYRPTEVSPLTDLVQNSIQIYIPDDKTVYQILSI